MSSAGPSSPGPLPVAIALATGIAIARLLDVPRSAAWVAALVLVVLAARLRRAAGPTPRTHPYRRVCRVVVLVAAVSAGIALGTPRPIDLRGVDDRELDRIEGVVDGLVVATPRGFGMRLRDVDVVDAAAPTIRRRIPDVWVWTTERGQPGERVAATGRLHTPRGSLGPGQPDRADAVAARGARLELVATTLVRVSDDAGALDRVWRWAMTTQEAWSARIAHAGGDPAARAALRGIVVGDRADIPDALDARWRAVGVFHVLSVSGLHLAVVAGLAFALLRRAIAASPLGGRVRPARWAAVPALVIAVAYTLVTGAQLATLRALGVIALVLVAAALDRPLKLVDAIGIAAIGVLAWRPADLFDPSFQLSFVAGLVLAVSPTVTERRGVRGWIVRGLATSAFVALATAPVTAYHFQQVQPGGIAGNLVLTPLLELVALPLALAGVIVGWDAPIAAATWLVGRLDGAAGLVEHVMPIGHVAIGDGVSLAVIVALSIVVASRPRWRALAWLALCVAWSIAGMPSPSGELRVTFVDVGQGDAAIVELPDGAVWLVDAGGLANARDLAQASAPGRTIARTLAVYGKRRVDLAIVSHPHPDHYLGLASLGVPVGEVWSAHELEPSNERSFAALVERLGSRQVHPPLGVARSEAGVDLVVWAPRYGEPTAAIEAADPVRTVNDNSLVVELRYRGRSILFAGDVEAEGEEALVAAGIRPVDVVKVAHHGSPTSSSPAFVDATRPTLAVISCGRANQFGFPAAAVVERWREVGADVARTDRDGSVTVRIDPAGGLAVRRFATPAR